MSECFLCIHEQHFGIKAFTCLLPFHCGNLHAVKLSWLKRFDPLYVLVLDLSSGAPHGRLRGTDGAESRGFTFDAVTFLSEVV